MGVGVKGGAEANLHLTKLSYERRLTSSSSSRILQIDFCNAFNSVKRSEKLKAVASVDKCELWSTVDLDRLDERLKRNIAGLEVLEPALGYPGFVCMKLYERVFFEKLDYLDDPQCALGFQRHGIGPPKMVYSLHCQKPAKSVIKSLKDFDAQQRKKTLTSRELFVQNNPGLKQLCQGWVFANAKTCIKHHTLVLLCPLKNLFWTSFDLYGGHAIACQGGGDEIARHDRIRDNIVYVCSSVNLSPVVEKNLIPESQSLPRRHLCPGLESGETCI